MVLPSGGSSTTSAAHVVSSEVRIVPVISSITAVIIVDIVPLAAVTIVVLSTVGGVFATGASLKLVFVLQLSQHLGLGSLSHGLGVLGKDFGGRRLGNSEGPVTTAAGAAHERGSEIAIVPVLSSSPAPIGVGIVPLAAIAVVVGGSVVGIPVTGTIKNNEY